MTVPVKTKVKAKHGLEVTEREPGVWLLRPEERKETSLEISGDVPTSAKTGDVLLVNVTATYPRIKGRVARTVEFLGVRLCDRQKTVMVTIWLSTSWRGRSKRPGPRM